VYKQVTSYFLFSVLILSLLLGSTASAAFLQSTGPTQVTGSVNLTTEGTSDWAHWYNNFDRKAGAGQQISDFIQLGTEAAVSSGSSATYVWSDGTPTANANTSTGLRVFSVNNGFRVNVSADTTPRTLRFYVGARNARGLFTASLSDGSAAPFSVLINQPSGAGSHVVTLNYQAQSVGQSLTIDYIMETRFATGTSSQVRLESATLVGGSAGNLPPTITSPGNQTNTLGDSVNLQVAATDPNPADVLTFSSTTLPTGLTISNSGLITGNTTADGAFTTSINVSDGNGGTDSATFTWSVNTNGGGGGSLSGSSDSISGSVNLTTEGTSDWVLISTAKLGSINKLTTLLPLVTSRL